MLGLGLRLLSKESSSKARGPILRAHTFQPQIIGSAAGLKVAGQMLAGKGSEMA